MLNAVLNSTQQRSKEPIDIGVYDVEKCFDTMWAKEALNNAYDLGFMNDKLPLVHLTNNTASIAVKSSTGISDRATIRSREQYTGSSMGRHALYFDNGQTRKTCLRQSPLIIQV